MRGSEEKKQQNQRTTASVCYLSARRHGDASTVRSFPPKKRKKGQRRALTRITVPIPEASKSALVLYFTLLQHLRDVTSRVRQMGKPRK